ncbi:YlbL family protein [Ornithinimicrobium sp. W1679]|uniref:YlbL family protein n=1 Tax=unclassified Ornithinimicrobium TaxID=2615080 RepID=UPI003CE76C98
MSEGYHHGYPQQPRTKVPHTGIGRRSGAALLLVPLLVVAGAAASWVGVDKVVYEPGPLFDTLDSIDGTPVVELDPELEDHPTEGDLFFTTVRLDGGPGEKVTLLEWGRAALDPALTVHPREDIFPEQVTAEQVREQNTELMEHSQQDAAVVALREAGLEVPEEIVVAQVIADAPADGVLHVDDEILTVEGEEMTDAETVRSRLQEVTAGESASMTLLREGEEVTLDVPTVRDEETGRTIVGVYLAPRYDMPYDVTISAGNVGGPSAGLMFSLAIYDRITPGALTGGRSVAGTGTISGLGNVGPISGIRQKMYAADDAGVELFLAPSENCDEVLQGQPADLLVVPVATFDEARAHVEAVASADDVDGLDLPTCRTLAEEQAPATG